MEDRDGDLFAERAIDIVSEDGLNHGLALHGGFIYASTLRSVFRWPDTLIEDARRASRSGLRKDQKQLESLAANQREIVVKNMNDELCHDCGALHGHSTRTLAFDSIGRLYVSIGSLGNVDKSSWRSRIRRFNL